MRKEIFSFLTVRRLWACSLKLFSNNEGESSLREKRRWWVLVGWSVTNNAVDNQHHQIFQMFAVLSSGREGVEGTISVSHVINIMPREKEVYKPAMEECCGNRLIGKFALHVEILHTLKKSKMVFGAKDFTLMPHVLITTSSYSGLVLKGEIESMKDRAPKHSWGWSLPTCVVATISNERTSPKSWQALASRSAVIYPPETINSAFV